MQTHAAAHVTSIHGPFCYWQMAPFWNIGQFGRNPGIKHQFHLAVSLLGGPQNVDSWLGWFAGTPHVRNAQLVMVASSPRLGPHGQWPTNRRLRGGCWGMSGDAAGSPSRGATRSRLDSGGRERQRERERETERERERERVCSNGFRFWTFFNAQKRRAKGCLW